MARSKMWVRVFVMVCTNECKVVLTQGPISFVNLGECSMREVKEITSTRTWIWFYLPVEVERGAFAE